MTSSVVTLDDVHTIGLSIVEEAKFIFFWFFFWMTFWFSFLISFLISFLFAFLFAFFSFCSSLIVLVSTTPEDMTNRSLMNVKKLGSNNIPVLIDMSLSFHILFNNTFRLFNHSFGFVFVIFVEIVFPPDVF